MVIVRPATEADAADIARVCTRSARAAYAGLVTADYLERVLAHFFSAERLAREVRPGPGWFGFTVAERQDGVAGVAGTGQSAQDTDACELYTLYVDPAAQRAGVGRALLEASVLQATRTGARRLHAAILPGNLQAIRFYTACGFTPAGTRPIYAPHGEHGGPDTALVYAKTL